jgi:hypothetical protein
MTLPEYPSINGTIPVMINMLSPAIIENMNALALYLTFALLSHVPEDSISLHHDANP